MDLNKRQATGNSKKMYIPAPNGRKENRHERRKAESLVGKKNTRGFPLGYNKQTWDRLNASEGGK